MAIFRPSNINKRLLGTTNSPGNGGQIGPSKTPYCGKATLALGCRFSGGSCGGIFKTKESLCGRKENCGCAVVDCKGYFYCCSGATKYFVSPIDTQGNEPWVNRGNAVTNATNAYGSLSWFFPDCATMLNAACCGIYWDSGGGWYWTDTAISGTHIYRVNFGPPATMGSRHKGNQENIRAFRSA